MQYHLLIGRSCQESRGCKRGIGPLGGISWGGTVSNFCWLLVFNVFFNLLTFANEELKLIKSSVVPSYSKQKEYFSA